jgi:hypothetical protein
MPHRLRLQGRADKKSDDPVTTTTRLALRRFNLVVATVADAQTIGRGVLALATGANRPAVGVSCAPWFF